MKRFSVLALMLMLVLSVSMHDAQARRLGGGMSSGMKRGSSITQRQVTPPSTPAQNMGQSQAARSAATSPQSSPPQMPQTQPSGMRRWLGPLAGLAAGVGLAALFSHMGMGAGMGSFMMLLLIGGALLLGIRFLMKRMTPSPQMQPVGAGLNLNLNPNPNLNPDSNPNLGAGTGASIEPAVSSAITPSMSAQGDAAPHIPADFDVAGFLRQAKLNFIRLQAANDAGNMDDLRAFTSPEMYAEIQMQYQERGKMSQHTDVMQLEAVLLDVMDEPQRQLASVRFFGLIRETEQASPENFSEVWHLTRARDGSQGWVIAGIEQTS